MISSSSHPDSPSIISRLTTSQSHHRPISFCASLKQRQWGSLGQSEKQRLPLSSTIYVGEVRNLDLCICSEMVGSQSLASWMRYRIMILSYWRCRHFNASTSLEVLTSSASPISRLTISICIQVSRTMSLPSSIFSKKLNHDLKQYFPIVTTALTYFLSMRLFEIMRVLTTDSEVRKYISAQL